MMDWKTYDEFYGNSDTIICFYVQVDESNNERNQI